MHRFLLLLVCLSCLPQTVFGQITDSHRQAAMDLMEASQVQKMMVQMSEQMAASFAGAYSAEELTPAQQTVLDDHAREVFDLTFSRLMSDEALAQIAEIYAESFSEEELREIAAFYESSVGQKMIERMPAMASKSMQMSMRMLEEIGPEIQALSEKFRKDMEAASQPSE